MDREKFIKAQTTEVDETFSLTTGEEETRARFEKLTLDTYDFKAAAGGVRYALPFRAWPEAAGNFLDDVTQESHRRRYPLMEVPTSLIQRWREWNEEYERLIARNPRLALRDMMQEISESHTASSWPVRYERHIQAWVDAGDPETLPPFDDRYGIVTPEFYERLRELRKLCGGWLYWDEKLDRVVFASESEWQQIRAAQEEAEAKSRRAWEESQARQQQLAKRHEEVMSAARQDARFWESLKAWELAREARRPPPEPPKPVAAPGVVRLQAMNPDEQGVTKTLCPSTQYSQSSSLAFVVQTTYSPSGTSCQT